MKNCTLLLALLLSLPSRSQQHAEADFRFIAFDRYLVIASADTLFATGAAKAVSTQAVFAAVKNADKKRITPAHKAWIGRRFQVFDKSGNSYSASVKHLKYMISYYPSYGEALGLPGDSMRSIRDTGAHIWNSGSWMPGYLVGELDFGANAPKNLYGAVQEKAALPLFYSPGKEQRAWLAAGHAALDDSENMKEIRERYEGEGEWDRDAYAAETFFEGQGRRFASRSVMSGTPCGDEFYAELSAFWEIDEKGRAKILFDERRFVSIVTMLDVDHDGVPELVISDSGDSLQLLQRGADGWETRAEFSVQDFRCPC